MENLEKVAKRAKDRKVPGRIPEAPNISNFVNPDANSLAASSVSSFSSVLNLVSGPEVSKTGNGENRSASNQVKRLAETPTYVYTRPQTERNLVKSQNTATPTPVSSQHQTTASKCSQVSAQNHWESRAKAIDQSSRVREEYNTHLNQQRAAEQETARTNYVARKKEEAQGWMQWQTATTSHLLAQQASRQEVKKTEEANRRAEFQQMIDLEIQKSRQSGRSQGYQSGEDDRRRVSVDSTESQSFLCKIKRPEATQRSRKQNLFHRLVRPSNYVEKPVGYQPVETTPVLETVEATTSELAASAVDPESLFFVNGELLDLGCFEESQSLSSRAIDSYLTVLEAKNATTLTDKKLQIWSSQSPFYPVKAQVGVCKDGNVNQVATRAFEVTEDFLTAVANGEDAVVSIMSNSGDSVAYVVNKVEKTIYVKDHPTQSRQQCFSKLARALERRLQEDNWSLNFPGKSKFSNVKQCDSSVNALHAVETFVAGTESLPGVNTLSDYRQKLKWSVINEADTCLKAINGTKQEVRQRLKECQKQLLEKVEAARNLAELLNALPDFKVVGNKLFCKRCVGSKSFKPITLPGNDEVKNFYYLKGHVVKHLKSDSHCKNIGFQVKTDEHHPENEYRSVKSLNDLQMLYPWLHKAEDSILKCLDCNESDSIVGKFSYPEEESPDFASKFSALKSRVRAHANLESHRAREAKQSSEFNRAVGRTLGLNAYMCIKDGLGLNQYERQVNNDFAKQLAVGELNHCRDFAAEMRKCFAEVLKTKFVAQTTRIIASTEAVPKISIDADKVTDYGRTFHVVAAVTHIGGKNHSFLLDVVEASGDDGDHMARDVYETLLKYFPPDVLKDIVVGACMDGQYHNNHVPEKLMDLMGIAVENRDAYSYQWDYSHVLELACKDARGQKKDLSSISETWIRNTLTTMNSVSSDYRYGASLRQLKELSAELEREVDNVPGVRRFQTYSATRFSAHLSKFINVMDHNYPVLLKHLEENDRNSFATMSSPDFVMRMTGLGDIYKLVGDTSKQLQLVHKMPWHSTSAIDNLRTQLGKIVEACSAANFRPAPEVLPRFSNCCSEMLAFNTYKGQDLNFNSAPAKRTRNSIDQSEQPLNSVVNREAAAVADHARALMEKLDSRFLSKPGRARKTVSELYGSDTLGLISDCFNFEKIREWGSNKVQLKKLYDVYSASGLLKAGESFEVLERQHEQLCAEVIQTFPEVTDVQTETDYYYGKLDGPETSYPLLMETLSLSANRNCVESVVETMSSQLGSVLDGRTSLTTSNLCDELIVRHNGPPAGPKAEKLVEAALDQKFKSKPWKFQRFGTNKSQLKVYPSGSKVLSRLQEGEDKIVF